MLGHGRLDASVGINIVGLKWVFWVKKYALGKIVRYKACLVAQGFSQVPRINYFDTFAPVTHLASIHTVLSVATVEDFQIYQIGIKSAYLNSVLKDNEVIYMYQAPDYMAANKTAKVYCL